MSAIVIFNITFMVLFTVAFSYQAYYVLIGLIRKPRAYETHELHRFAAITCGRNEAGVIAQLIKSLKDQDYPADMLDVFVVADNCTDNTAVIAEQAGAIVFKRNNKEQVGKSWALDYGLNRILTEYADRDYEGFFVFDSDNLVHPGFVAAMNAAYDNGEQILTSYRNTKNFGTSWISMACSLWFLREARYLSYSRASLGTSCLIGGTGFFVSAQIIKENGGWPFHTLTEDIEFSVSQVTRGYKIGYCHDAIIYDEQPETLKAAWTQRLRWSKGFYQVLFHYFKGLIASLRHGFKQGCEGESTPSTPGRRRFSCYDVFMTISPAMAITATSLCVNGIWLIAASNGMYADPLVYRVTFIGFFLGLLNTYLMFLGLGALTLVTERSRINATTGQMVRSAFVFPLFMLLQIPISVQALFAKVGWKPIAHTVNINLEQLAAAKK